MELCAIARAVLLFSVIGTFCDIYLFGISFLSLVSNILVAVFLVWLANWSCFTEGYNWVAWIIVIVLFFSLTSLIYIIKNKNKEEEKKIIEEEKKKRERRNKGDSQ
jgi:phosphotransferase system  glucose/maltose/N-acetylglucosamine-specific IIC component